MTVIRHASSNRNQTDKLSVASDTSQENTTLHINVASTSHFT